MIGSHEYNVGAVGMSAIEDLEKLESTLVDQRRELVPELWKIGEPRQEHLDSLIDIQRSIDAVKSAIEDEKSRAASGYEAPDTFLEAP
jgi:hypothetical protein